MYKIYTVKDSETLSSIANKLRISVDELRKINGFSRNYEIKLNEQIIVPSTSADPFDLYIVKKGDSLYGISQLFNIKVDDLANLNGLDKENYLYPGQELIIPKESVNFYITKDGDTLRTAALNLKTSIENLIVENELIYLLPNQLLISNRKQQN